MLNIFLAVLFALAMFEDVVAAACGISLFAEPLAILVILVRVLGCTSVVFCYDKKTKLNSTSHIRDYKEMVPSTIRLRCSRCVGGADNTDAAAVSDRVALMTLFEAWGRPKALRSWGSEGPLATWHGVKVTATERVKTLHLKGCGLTGAIPSELGQLVELTEIHLSNNQLTGAIPSELGQLVALTTLYLNKNQLTGAIPSELGQLVALTKINLSFNQLTGAIPSELGQLVALTTLLLNENRLTGAIPSELGQLVALTTLWLNNNQLTGAIPSELGQLVALTTLVLVENRLTGRLPKALRSIPDLNMDAAQKGILAFPPPPSQPVASRMSLAVLWLGVGLYYFDVVSDVLAAVEFHTDDHLWWFGLSLGLVVGNTLIGAWSSAQGFDAVEMPWLVKFMLGLSQLHILVAAFGSWATGMELEVLLASKFEEVVMESAPQLLLQSYVVLVLWEEDFGVLLPLSVALSFLSLSVGVSGVLDNARSQALFVELQAQISRRARSHWSKAAVKMKALVLHKGAVVRDSGASAAAASAAVEKAEVAIAITDDDGPAQVEGGRGVEPTTKNDASTTQQQAVEEEKQRIEEMAGSLVRGSFILVRMLGLMSRGLVLVLLGVVLRGYAGIAVGVIAALRLVLFTCRWIPQDEREEESAPMISMKRAWISLFVARDIIPEGSNPHYTRESLLLFAAEAVVASVLALAAPDIVETRPYPLWVAVACVLLVWGGYLLRCALDEALKKDKLGVRWARGCVKLMAKMAAKPELVEWLETTWDLVDTGVGTVA